MDIRKGGQLALVMVVAVLATVGPRAGQGDNLPAGGARPPASFTIEASPPFVDPGGSVTARWSVSSATQTDAIGLVAAGAGFPASGPSQRSGGARTGSLSLVAPTAPGSYELVYLRSRQVKARSNPFTVQSTRYSVSVSPTTVPPGSTVTASWSASSARPAGDRLGLRGTSNYIAFVTLNGGSSGSGSFTAPTQAGEYRIVYILADGTETATSNAFAVSEQCTVSVNSTRFSPGSRIRVTWNTTSPRPRDWVALARVGSAVTEYVRYTYTDGRGAGSLEMDVPSEPGNYEARFLVDDTYRICAVSSPFAVAAVSDFTISVTPSRGVRGGLVEIRWTAPEGHSRRDQIGIAYPDQVAFLQNGSSETGSSTSGSAAYSTPVVEGTYEVRYYSEDQRRVVATARLDIAGLEGYRVSVGPSSVPRGTRPDFSWNRPTRRSVTDYLDIYRADGTRYSEAYAYVSNTSGTVGTVRGPSTLPAGDYELRYRFGDKSIPRTGVPIFAASARFSVR